MTDKEKALGYLMILKMEGKLDESALPELKNMYKLSDEEVDELLYTFKEMPEYSNSLMLNLKRSITLFLLFATIAGCFAFASFSKTGFEGFFIYFIVFVLGALGSFVYSLKLANEKYRFTNRFKWLQNRGLFLLPIAIVYFGYNQYQVTGQTYIAHPDKWVRLKNAIISKNCNEISTGGKYPDYYYAISIENYLDPFQYDQQEHYYQFNGNYPNRILKKGDTITLWVERNEIPDMLSSSRNKVWDIEIRGKRLLNIATRNNAAERVAKEKRNNSLLLLIIAALLYFYHYVNQRKKSVS